MDRVQLSQENKATAGRPSPQKFLVQEHFGGNISTPNWRSRFFWENSRLPESMPKVPNGPICSFDRYDSIFLRIGSLVFLIFYMKLRDHKYWKLTGRIFWENSCLPESRPKVRKWPNLCVRPLPQHFLQDCLISFFLYFA